MRRNMTDGRLAMREGAEPNTKVRCKCGVVLLELRPEESIMSGTTFILDKKVCKSCGAQTKVARSF